MKRNGEKFSQTFYVRMKPVNAVLPEAQLSRRRSSFRRQLGLFCQRSTLHGLSDLYRAFGTWLFAFWSLTFFGAMAAAVYGCYHIMELYMEAPIVVSYFVHESDMNFSLPDLIVCPFNRFNAEFLRENNISYDVAQHMQLTFGSSAKYPAQRDAMRTYMRPSVMEEHELQMNETLNRLNMTFDQFFEAASLQCRDVFIDCVFPRGQRDCCANIVSIITFAGKCFRIPSVNQSGPGYGFGISVVISLPKNLYSVAVNNWLDDGVLVKLAEPHQGTDYDMTLIPIGTHALLPLKATKYEFMDDPPRFKCLQETSENYSRVDCFDACYLETAQNACGCVLFNPFNRNSKLPLCTTSQFYKCVFMTLSEQFKNGKEVAYFSSCRQRCQPRCTYWQYQSSISYSKFPSPEARDFARSEEEWERMKNAIILDLYYEKLEFTRIKHHRAMSVHGFIANLGGQYSLWLGGSILTLMQILVFACSYVVGRLCGLRARAASDAGRTVAVFGDLHPRLRRNNSRSNGLVEHNHHHHHHHQRLANGSITSHTSVTMPSEHTDVFQQQQQQQQQPPIVRRRNRSADLDYAAGMRQCYDGSCLDADDRHRRPIRRQSIGEQLSAGLATNGDLFRYTRCKEAIL